MTNTIGSLELFPPSRGGGGGGITNIQGTIGPTVFPDLSGTVFLTFAHNLASITGIPGINTLMFSLNISHPSGQSSGVVIFTSPGSLSTISGSPGQILSISATGSPQFETFTFIENSGSATFSATDTLSILGAGLISTSGSGSTVTISLSGSGSFSSNGVVYFNGSSLVTVTGSAGQILTINSTSGAPQFSTFTFIENSGSATFSATDTLSILGAGLISTSGSGSTVTISLSGSGSFSSNGVVYFNGSSLVTVTGSAGQILTINSTSGAPQFSTFTFVENSGSATFSATDTLNILGAGLISTSGSGSTVTISLSGSGSLSTNGVVYFNGSSLATVTGSAGQILTINSTSGAPQFSTFTFIEDSGSATFSATDTLSIVGAGGGISTSGTGSTVMISLSGFGSLASNGVVYFNGSSLATVTGSAGQILTINSTSGAPQFSTFTFIEDSGSATFSATDTLSIVGAGGGISTSGTGSTVMISLSGFGSLASNGVVYFNGSSLATVTGSAGQILTINSTSGAPQFSTFTFIEDSGSATFSATDTLSIVGAGGGISTSGTGSTVMISLSGFGSLASNGVVYFNGSSFATVTGSAGQILTINSTSGAPQFSTFTFVENSGSATFSATDTLNILGAGLISTSGSGSTVTISLSGSGSLSTNGVVYFNGSSLATVTGSAGQILTINSTSGAPQFSTFTFIEDSGSATFSATDTLSIVGGGGISTSGSGSTVSISLSGFGSLSSNGVVYFDGSSLATVTGNTGQTLVIDNTGTPAFVDIQGTNGIDVTSGGGTITIDADGIIAESFDGDSGTATPVGHVLNIFGDGIITTTASGGTVAIDLGVVPVMNGGTGATTLATGGVLYGDGTNPVNTVVLPSGMVLQGSNASFPQPAMLVSGTGIIISNDSSSDPGTITIFATGATVGFSWQIITISTPLSTNTGYICEGGVPLILTLPNSGSVGDIIEVTADSVTSWSIQPFGGSTQQIQMGSHKTTTMTGSLTSALGDSVRIVCISGTPSVQQWVVLSGIGTLVVN